MTTKVSVQVEILNEKQKNERIKPNDRAKSHGNNSEASNAQRRVLMTPDSSRQHERTKKTATITKNMAHILRLSSERERHSFTSFAHARVLVCPVYGPAALSPPPTLSELKTYSFRTYMAVSADRLTYVKF